MAPHAEASLRTAVATQNRLDLDATLVRSSHSLPIGNVLPDCSISECFLLENCHFSTFHGHANLREILSKF